MSGPHFAALRTAGVPLAQGPSIRCRPRYLGLHPAAAESLRATRQSLHSDQQDGLRLLQQRAAVVTRCFVHGGFTDPARLQPLGSDVTVSSEPDPPRRCAP